jgi:hypothetical protein
MRNYSVSYTQNLPNFLCIQVTRRYVSFNGPDNFRQEDRVLTKLSYNEGHENYKVYQVNNRQVDMSLEQLGGAISNGEFGSMLRDVFADRSEADFTWDHWGTLRGKKMAVFRYSVDSAHSTYMLDFDRGAQKVITAYKGLVYADQDTGVVSRITFESENIPPSFPIRDASTVLDYDDAKIGDSTYFLPLRALVRITGPNNVHTKNEEEFRMYQKFGTESSITFGDDATAPLPPEKTEEQPPAPSNDPLMKGLPPPPPK